MEWLVDKAGDALNSYASVIDGIVQTGSKLESTLSPTASSLIRGFLGNDVLTAGFFVMIIGTVVSFLKDSIINTFNDLLDWFYVSVEVDENDMCYDWLSDWLSTRLLNGSVRHFTVKAVWGTDNDDWFETNDKFDEDRPELVFMPGTGSHILYHKGHKITVSRERPDSISGSNFFSSNFMSSYQKKESITISTFGRDVSLLRSIIKDAMEESFKKNSGKTTIYCCQGSDRYWSYMGSRTPRAFHTVVLAKGIKEALLDDISTFRRSAGWYRERGIPYRRGYLLHGPPGTGKTSFIIALAGHLGLSVCILNLSASGLDDQQLDQLMNDAPRNSIILIEDIDAALLDKKPGETQSGKNNVTLSGLLNALDGVTAHEGSIMFMTTNYIKKLAPALIRPGRCDRKLLFDYADSHQVREMFLRFFLGQPSDYVKKVDKPKNVNEDKSIIKLSLLKKSKTNSDDEKDTAVVADVPDPEEQARRLEHDAMVRRLANRMAELITKEDAITPAQLQGFFLQYRNEPETIHAKVDDFKLELIANRKEQAEKKRLLRERHKKKEAKEKAKKEKERAKKEKERAKKRANGEDVDSSDSSSDEENDNEGSKGGSDFISDSDDDEGVHGLSVANGKSMANGKSAPNGAVFSS
ncbi:hypothetical protein DFQ26_004393 [Actinomortierella ambigua]|nr:hypothetical protein DFQ26_004393 [Actinomortierella ambigua]